jgi:hypothetical protein
MATVCSEKEARMPADPVEVAGAMSGNDELTIETDQHRDGLVRLERGDTQARILHLRCQESRAQSSPGQDYAKLALSGDGSSLSFCVCDGVGGSYRGDFAAAYLAARLVAWLRALDAIPEDGEAVRAPLTAALAEWAREGQVELCQTPISTQLGILVREVLEELRASHGSEAVFVAGRLDIGDRATTSDAPTAGGVRQAHALLCWMGNVTPRLLRAGHEVAVLPYIADDRNRWSTARGLSGRLSLQALTLEGPHRFIAHTDGLNDIGNAIASLSDEALDASARHLLSLPTNDDMTVLDVQWRASDDA